MLYFEEGTSINDCTARGKILWIDKEITLKHLPKYAHIFGSITIDRETLLAFKEEVIELLKKKKYHFFEDSVYRYRTSRGKIVEFGVSYMKID